MRWSLPASAPPLTPSGDDARSALRRELLHADYHQDNLVQRLIDWLQRVLGNGLDAARGAPPVTTLAAMLVGLLLVGGIAWLVGRARRTPRTPAQGVVLTGEAVTAAELRTRAEQALHEERFGDAVVDAFRAVTVRQVERDQIDDLPGATAREVAMALAEVHPAQADGVHRCAGLFDQVLYGHRAATRAQASEVLALDDRLGEPVGARS